MPWSNVVGSLQSLCVQSVAENLDKVQWDQHFLEDEGDPRCPKISPFALLFHTMLKSIFEAIKKTKGTTREEDHLGFLITKKLEELSLKYFPGLSESAAFHLLTTAALRRSSLRILTFSFRTIPYHKLRDILPVFPNLQVLDVSRTRSVNENFLSLIASSCPQLKSLHLEGCGGVTDAGMERLCTAKGGDLCNSLIKLEILRTPVTEKGARLVLKHFVKLEELTWDSTGPLVALMYRSGHRRPLALRTLHFKWQLDGLDFETNSLVDAVKLCPSVFRVDIDDYYEPSSQDLRALLELDNLQRLLLRGTPQLSFEEDLVPILKKFGHTSLNYLMVTNMDQVNIGAFVEHCSKLRFLYIHDVKGFVQSHLRPGKSNKPYLPHLEYLAIRAMDDDLRRLDYSGQPSGSDLTLLLNSAPGLVDLKLEELDNVDDRILQEVVAHHGFPDLEELEITSCPNVTKSVVNLFLDLDNPLSSFMIERYKHWDTTHEGERGDYEDPAWREKIMRNNLKLFFYYCECSAW